MCDARLRNSAVHVAYSRGPQPMRHIRPRFHNPCGIYSRSSAIYAVYTAGSPQSILCNNISYRNIQSSVRYISAQCRIADTEAYRYKLASFSIPQSPHYIKKAQGCAEGRGLVPLCGFLTFQCDPNVIYPLRDSAVHVAYSREPQSMRLYDRSSAIHTAYTAEIPQSMRAFGRGLRSPCGYYFPIQNLENISLTRSSPSDSPRIRPRLSYASVRSME